MAIDLAFATGSGVTVTNTEMSLATTGGTTTGVPQSITTVGVFRLWLDGVANMVKADEYLLKVYEKVRASGIQRVVFQARLLDAQSEIYVMPSLELGIGWDITLQRISSTSRAFDWSIRRIS
jgi:hypothetical protein